MFIHDALKEFIACGNTEVEAGHLKSKYPLQHGI